MSRRLSPFLAVMMTLGFVFLYGPIVSVIAYSFNASRLVTVWAGFSTRWYRELLQNDQIKSAALTKLLHLPLQVRLGSIERVQATFKARPKSSLFKV